MSRKKNKNEKSKRIFTYWVNDSDSSMPPYIQLCLKTWYANIPNVEVVVINHDNLFKWIDPFFEMRAFGALSLPMQSDVVEFSVLYQHGGIFMDADTIITRDIFEELDKFERNKVYFFGNPVEKSVHLAFIACLKKRNKALLSCAEQEKELLRELLHKFIENKTADVLWDTFGNGVINNVINDERLSNSVYILDKIETGAILEASFMNDRTAFDNYIDFYFKNNDISFESVLEKIKFGAVLLHNSWTPKEYKDMSVEEVLRSNLVL